jgi:hypothetical protein
MSLSSPRFSDKLEKTAHASFIINYLYELATGEILFHKAIAMLGRVALWRSDSVSDSDIFTDHWLISMPL